jgi:hypothetical protein
MPLTACPTVDITLTATRPSPSTGVTGSDPGIIIPAGAIHWSEILTDGGSDGITAFCRWFCVDASDNVLSSDVISVNVGGTSTTHGPFGIPPGGVGIRFFFGSTGGTDVSSCGMTASTIFDGSCGVCNFGTQPQSGVARSLIITAGLVDLVCLSLGIPWAAVIFDVFIGQLLVPGTLCAGGPAEFPAFTQCDLDPTCGLFDPANLPRFWQAFQVAAWYTFCECSPNPGSGGPPTPPTPPSPTPPPSPPPPPGTVTCDAENLCSQLTQVFRQLNALQLQLANTNSLVTLIQRQKVPFGYVNGLVHAGLTGTGSFAVQGILGLAIESTTIPPTLSASMAPVNSYFRLGEISFGTASGYIRRQLVTHNPHLIPDIDGDVTIVAYLFEPGVVATVTELRREP